MLPASSEPSTALARNSSNIRGMLIFTGHASWHAPQSVLALGRSTPSFNPVSTGETTAPIGPGYTQPYAWPPTFRYTGHAFMQAPHRMQFNDSRRASSRSNLSRPLLTITR